MRDRKRRTVTATGPEALRIAAGGRDAATGADRKPEVTCAGSAQCTMGVSFGRVGNHLGEQLCTNRLVSVNTVKYSCAGAPMLI